MDRPILTALIAALIAGCSPTAVSPPPDLKQSASDVAKPAMQFDSKLAWAHLIKQCDFGPRYPGSAAHKSTRDWLQAEMKKHCENVRLQEFTHRWSVNGQTVTMWNVVGEQNWANAKTRILLLAHWDTRPTADMEWTEAEQRKPIVGANDGASGVAVLLELMRVMKARNPDLGIMYLMTDGEDLGPGLGEMFLGAKHFAKQLPNPKPDYGILLDMIGDKQLSIPIEPNSFAFAKPLVQAFYAHTKRQGLEKYFPQNFGTTIEDDHIPLNRAGLPTMDLIDFDYDPWHTLADTPDKCSAASLGVVGQALESWLTQSPPWKYPKP